MPDSVLGSLRMVRGWFQLIWIHFKPYNSVHEQFAGFMPQIASKRLQTSEESISVRVYLFYLTWNCDL